MAAPVPIPIKLRREIFVIIVSHFLLQVLAGRFEANNSATQVLAKLTACAQDSCIMKLLARFVLPAAWLVSTSALADSALACMNDRDSDSLALQARQLPETLRVITGRFERNSPLYYQMRIARSQAQL